MDDLELRTAIERLYRVFRGYEPGGPIDTCDHCVHEIDFERLQTVPVEDLTGDDLASYTFSAMLTVGDLRDLKHFLPRILELAAHDEWWVDAEIVTGRLRYGDWRSWPAEEHAAVVAYFRAWWHEALDSFPPDAPPFDFGAARIDAETCLRAIGQAEDELDPYLAVWRARSDVPALRHLAHLVLNSADQRSGRIDVRGAFWDDREQQARQVLAWLRDSGTAAQLERGFFAHSDHPAADEFSAALKWLTSD